MIGLARTPWRPALVTLLVIVSTFAAASLLITVGLEVRFTQTLVGSSELVADLADVRRGALQSIVVTHEALAMEPGTPAQQAAMAASEEFRRRVEVQLSAVRMDATTRARWLLPNIEAASSRWRELSRAAQEALETDRVADGDPREEGSELRHRAHAARTAFARATDGWNDETSRAFDTYADELRVTANRFVKIAVVDLAVSLGLLFAGAVLAHALIVRPLRSLRNALGRVAAGDFSARLDPTGTSEVEELARGFNVMLSALAQRDMRISAQSAALAERNRALLAANAELDHFAYAASHDLRAPLRGVDSMARFLEEDWGTRLDERSRGYLARIRRAAQRLDRLINDLLEVARAGRALGQTETLSIPDLVKEALDGVGESARAAGATIEVDELGDLPAIRGDHLRLVLVLQNLLSNAVKYSTGAGRTARVRVTGSRQDDRVRLSISDNGIGISQDQLERVFGLFKRLHRDAYEGTGVGLAIVKRITEAHGGKVWVESTVGQGSTFHVELPIEPVPQAMPVAATSGLEEP